MIWNEIFRIRIRFVAALLYFWFIFIHLGSIVFEGKLKAWHYIAHLHSNLYISRKTFKRMQKIAAEIAKYEGLQ